MWAETLGGFDSGLGGFVFLFLVIAAFGIGFIVSEGFELVAQVFEICEVQRDRKQKAKEEQIERKKSGGEKIAGNNKGKKGPKTCGGAVLRTLGLLWDAIVAVLQGTVNYITGDYWNIVDLVSAILLLTYAVCQFILFFKGATFRSTHPLVIQQLGGGTGGATIGEGGSASLVVNAANVLANGSSILGGIGGAEGGSGKFLDLTIHAYLTTLSSRILSFALLTLLMK